MAEDSRNDLMARVRKLNDITDALRNNPLPPHVYEGLARYAEVSRAFSLGDTSPTEATRPAVSPAPAQSPAEPAPVATESAWRVSEPERYRGYNAPLYRLLAAAHREGKPRPTARDVVEEWRINRPVEIAQVLADSVDYYDSNGNTESVNLNSIRKTIKRMTGDR